MKHFILFPTMLICLLLSQITSAQPNVAPEDTAAPVFMIVEEAPVYPGGTEAMSKFLSDNLRYPKKARRKGIEGQVIVSFVINEDGSINRITIVKGLGYGCDEEVIRVISTMPSWKPGRQKGENVKVRFLLPVRFQLP